MIILMLFSIWSFSVTAFGLMPCSVRNTQIKDLGRLYQQVAIIEGDNRFLRTPGDVSRDILVDIENAQARSYCLTRPYTGKGVPNKAYLTSHARMTSNATLAFEGDMAIVNRHLFIDRKAHQLSNIKNCFLEHLASGEIVPMIDVEYPAFDPKGGETYSHRDFAVVKLAHIPHEASFLRTEDILIDNVKQAEVPIKVVSNYANNNSGGRGKEALTMTNCTRFGQYSLPNGEGSNTFGTDCDTGEGSSGAQAYLNVDGSPKLFGIVEGELVKVPQGGKFDPAKLSTMITAFDQTLFDSFERLKSR